MNIRQLKLKIFGPIIPVISINQAITPKTTQIVQQTLKKINKDQMVALAVSISSQGGQPVQSQIIANKLINYAKSNNVKLYTFANDSVTAAAYYILSVGNHVYADRSSLIGNVNLSFMKYHLTGMLEYASVGQVAFSTQENLLSNYMNPYKSLTQQGKVHLQNLTKQCHQKMINQIKKNRLSKLKQQSANKNIFDDIYTGQQAAQNGLVDQLGTMVEVFSKKHPGAKLIFQDNRTFLHKWLDV